MLPDNDRQTVEATLSGTADSRPEPITKADLRKSWFLWYIFAEMSNSFERLQTLAFCACMIPILKKLYKTKEALSAALTRHLIFFNTEGDWGVPIHGVTIAMEEQKANGADVPDEAINGIKTGLMGPFAGIGDTLDYGTIKPIVLGLCIPLAITGSIMGAALPIILFVAITCCISYSLWMRGYSMGRESIMNILEGGWIQELITGAGVLGMFMMGVLSASFVKLSTPLKIPLPGSDPLAIQAIIDKIVPGLLPLIVVFGIYAYLVTKGPHFVRILVILLSISIISALLGVF
ncbi:MAG: PTS system mannose/fructose/sorbose family transporter subunit IID [Negativicutes bacterium]|nr:PTS system mannose/fructose/sorbose family transporter subunit IID [Negativicutes bacterium]